MYMINKFKLFIMMMVASLSAAAQDKLDLIESQLEKAPVQEKVYLHLDNNCYYKGDDIWYKAYVVRADDNSYTDMSRLLYVELVSPDGMLVERQTVVVNANGSGEGSFVLTDSLYSGFYEIRAYTRWMMNFCVTEHPSNRQSRELFYNRQMASDFFRLYGTVHSRVFPVYERPDEKGEYAQKYIVNRPKSRIPKELQERLRVTFYPEGGHLIAGTKATVAFEALDEEGQQVDIKGTAAGKTIATEHEGRGQFTIDVPDNGNLKATFLFEGKEYDFKLPNIERFGCALHLTDDKQKAVAQLHIRGAQLNADYAVAVLSQGVLKDFQRFRPDSKGQAEVTINKGELPSGVSDLIVIDPEGQPMADRLFFVRNFDYEQQLITVSADSIDYSPYAPITLTLKVPQSTPHLSVSVRDAATDDPTYDTGNILTELLLSSELKGFIPNPDYYFQADDDIRRQRLDLLLMVQGWRRYDYGELVSQQKLRYAPEKGLTVEGCVYPTILRDEFEFEEVAQWSNGVFGYTQGRASQLNPDDPLVKELNRRVAREDGVTVSTTESLADKNVTLEQVDQSLQLRPADGRTYTGRPESSRSSGNNSSSEVASMQQAIDALIDGSSDDKYNLEKNGLNREVVVECELVQVDDNVERREGTKIMGGQVETVDGGHFLFYLPPFAGNAILFLRAYDIDVSDRHKRNIDLKNRFNEEADPDYYVKRSLFHPVFAKKYSYYQWHFPGDEPLDTLAASEVADDNPLSSMDRTIKGLTVKGKRHRGRHAIDYTKPVCTFDTQELYNMATDYGLSYGRFNMENFPLAVSTMLLGTYNERRFFNVRARYNDGFDVPYVFYQNFSTDLSPNVAFTSGRKITDNIKLARQDEVRVFTDFELRNEDRPIVMQNDAPDVTLEFELMPNETKRYVYRDRRVYLSGVTVPDTYYQPDYSRRPLPDNWYDYRRTLYWNPNAKPDSNGQLTISLWNNGKNSRIRVSAAGITSDGMPVCTSEAR